MRVVTIQMQTPSRGRPESRPQGALYRSAALAVAVEALMLGSLFAWLQRPREIPPPQPMTIALAPQVEALTPAPVVPPTPPKPQPRPVVTPHHVPVVHSERRVEHVPQSKPVQQPVTPVAPAPVATAAPSEAAPVSRPEPPPPLAPSRPDASFEAALRATIQAALRYPEAARMAGMDGRARVAFVYRDGVVSDIRLVTSSGIGMLDRAALAAVRDATYPRPPAAYAGRSLSEQLWVNFNLDNQE